MRHLGAGVAAGLVTAGCEPGQAYALPALARPGLLPVVGPAQVRAIGSAYRGMVPAESDAEAIRDAILASLPWTSRLPWSGAPPVESRVRADFEHGRTVVVNGWVLSATEARQCALFDLQPT